MGRPKGIKKHLKFEQIEEIKTKVITSTPEEFRLKGFLWDIANAV